MSPCTCLNTQYTPEKRNECTDTDRSSYGCIRSDGRRPDVHVRLGPGVTDSSDPRHLRGECGALAAGHEEMNVKYWYKFYTTECPVCGRGRTSKERQYTPKPKSDSKRYRFTFDYDWCMG